MTKQTFVFCALLIATAILAYCYAQTSALQAAINYDTWLTNRASLPHSYFLHPFNRAFGYNDAAFWRNSTNQLLRNGSGCSQNLFVNGPYNTASGAIRPNWGSTCHHRIEIGTAISGPTANSGFTLVMWTRRNWNPTNDIGRFFSATSGSPPTMSSSDYFVYFNNLNGASAAISCDTRQLTWKFLGFIFNKATNSCLIYCGDGGTFSSPVACSEATIMITQTVLLSAMGIGGGGSDYDFSCVQMFNRALNASEFSLVRTQCNLLETIFDGVGPGSCRIDPNAPRWICDECYANSTSPMCLTPIKAADSFCTPKCVNRQSICTTSGDCRCLARFQGLSCDEMIGKPLTDPKAFMPHHSYLNDGSYVNDWQLVRSGSGNLVQPNNALRLTHANSNENGFMVSKLEFPFTDFTINATFEMDFVNSRYAEGLQIGIVSNASIHWNSAGWAINQSSMSGLVVSLTPPYDKIQLYVSRNMTAHGSVASHYNSSTGFRIRLKERFYIGIVVRGGNRVSVEHCTVQSCVRPFSDYTVTSGLPINPLLNPPVIIISAFTGAYGQNIDLIDFRAYSLTPPQNCACKARRGWCYANNKCLCKPGWTGATCSNQICGSKVCSPLAYCKSAEQSKCVCFDKWRDGDNCNRAICDCQNTGRCFLPQKCQCADGSVKHDCNEL